ncbi:MAG: hypothetical protein ABIG03_05185 [Candidatus Eisenbacteria bacterium]
MRPKAIRTAVAAVLFLVLVLLAGCIVVPVWWDGHNRAPRMAVVHVHVYDYYTYAPVSWAVVELYEESWWSWNYRGAWPVNMTGYTAAQGGYLYDDGSGGPQERRFGVEVSAGGYYPEWHELELDYWYPVETLSFYVVPWDDCAICGEPVEGQPPEIHDHDLPEGRVKVGEPDAVD